MNSDEEFAANIAQTVELVARGDIEAFVIPGQTALDKEGARRVAIVYNELTTAAVEHGRNLVLRWQFDPPGTKYATLNTVANAEKMLDALTSLAVDGSALPANVRVEFENLGPVPESLHSRLRSLGIAIL